MGASRRSFLKIVGLASVGLKSDPLTTVISNNEIYVNKKLGIAFRIPKEWYFYSVQQMDKMYDDQILKTTSSNVDKYFEELKNQPLVSIGMYPPDNDYSDKQFSPSITLRIEANDEGKMFEDVLTDSSLYISTIVNDFKTIENSPVEKICGYRSIKGKYGYLFEAEGIRSTPIIGRSCIIEVESHFYTFNMYNNDPENMEIDKMFDQLESSIMIL